MAADLTMPVANGALAVAIIEQFIAYLWTGRRQSAKLYIQETDLPLILPMVSDGTYAAAMASIDDMNAFVERLMNEAGAAANMDW